jgi:hypothetical protein
MNKVFETYPKNEYPLDFYDDFFEKENDLFYDEKNEDLDSNYQIDFINSSFEVSTGFTNEINEHSLQKKRKRSYEKDISTDKPWAIKKKISNNSKNDFYLDEKIDNCNKTEDSHQKGRFRKKLKGKKRNFKRIAKKNKKAF